MKTSARNHFAGKVVDIRKGAVNDEIDLDIGNGQKIIATVTRESTENLSLKVGGEAFALVKASSIILVTDEHDVKFSARNHLNGTVSRVAPGGVNSEIDVDLSGGISIAAIVTNESVKNLDLKTGAKVAAIFKVSNVIIGVRA